MKASPSIFIRQRDIVSLELETEAKKSFVTIKKKHEVLEDAEWKVFDEFYVWQSLIQKGETWVFPFPLTKFGDYTSWNSLASLEATAAKLHSSFSKAWKAIKKCYPYHVTCSNPKAETDFSPKGLYSFARMDLVNLLTLLLLDESEEVEKWTRGSTFSTPHSSFI